jgi:hypothetical protein
MEKKFYYLDLSANKCNVLGLLNGFPIYELKAPSMVNFAMPINTALIGMNNQLSIAMTPASYEEPMNLATFDPMTMTVKGAVKVYGEGEISAPKNGERILEINLVGSPGTFSFDNDLINFSSLFLNSPEIEEEEIIEKYALYLRYIFEKKDVELIMKEFDDKLRGIAFAFFEDFSASQNDFRAFMENIFLPLEPNLAFDEFDLRLRSWCDNRIWEIAIYPNRELLVSSPDDDGYEYAIKVFVAMVDGELKVVR